jgi:hypothetical protein
MRWRLRSANRESDYQFQTIQTILFEIFIDEPA